MRLFSKCRLATALALCPGPLLAAEIACSFSQECFETEACADTTYELSVVTDVIPAAGATAIGAATLSDETGERSSIIIAEREYVLIESQTENARVVLAVTPDGTSRYQVLYPEQPLSVVYFGTCDGVF